MGELQFASAAGLEEGESCPELESVADCCRRHDIVVVVVAVGLTTFDVPAEKMFKLFSLIFLFCLRREKKLPLSFFST